MTVTPARQAPEPRSAGATPSSRHRAAAARPIRFALLRLITAGVMAVIMADTVATTMAIPALVDDTMTRGIPLPQLTWISTINFAVIAALLATAGRCADLLGRRGLLALGLALFAGGAVGAVIAVDWPILLAGRLVQGIGAAMIIPASLGMLLSELPLERRGGAIALWSSAGGVGALALHGFGGLLLEMYGWRALYLPSAIIGLALLVLTPGLPRSRPGVRRMPDLIGAVALVCASGALVLLISQAGIWDWRPTLLCAVGAMVLLDLAVVRSRRHPAAAVDTTLWRRPGFAWGGIATFAYGLLCFPVLAIAPLFLRDAGVDAGQIGTWLVPMSLAVIVASPLAAIAGRRTGVHAIIYLGSLAVGSASVLLLAHPEPGRWSLVASIVLGAGFGAMATGASSAGTLTVEPAQHGAAVGAITTTRMLGGALGVAAASTVISHAVTEGPEAGYALVLIGCLLIAALTGALSIVQVIRGRGRALGVATVAVTNAQVTVPRRLLLELRASFVQISAEADNALARLAPAPAAMPLSAPTMADALPDRRPPPAWPSHQPTNTPVLRHPL
ncbi:MFS transporter [Nonomuraea sp. NPDC046570]|uniref:MFS transporter n=1 Tax=Nonomuraea sp. NPDC046570 TaxID=3155255 RepID=UPI00340DFBAC